jgi:splicing factor U2AF subunit
MAICFGNVSGIEEVKVNCPFYRIIGACRYENKCLRIHSVPSISQTLLFKVNLYIKIL